MGRIGEGRRGSAFCCVEETLKKRLLLFRGKDGTIMQISTQGMLCLLSCKNGCSNRNEIIHFWNEDKSKQSAVMLIVLVGSHF